ncbi:MAG: hypothetical protein HY902_00205 [Deltaproteobacteria bacterium]|nr:hypothetical protein [Deltaproteobacteria bacterium]
MASCGAAGGGGGGGGAFATGGAVGSPCDPNSQTVGCVVGVSPPQRVHCGSDGKWQLDGACQSGEICVESYQGTQKVAGCVAGSSPTDTGGSGQDAAGTDSSDDATSGTDATVVATDSEPGDTAADVAVQDVGPVCGDGTCEGGETQDSCPGDCLPKPVCGNGKCEVGESPGSCASDCKAECVPACGSKKCGDNGCGGVCGTCDSASSCNASGQCLPKGPVCGNGSCEAGETYGNCPGDCPCVPQCGTKKCGDNGCGGLCGTCDSASTCNASGQCIATSKCGNGTCDSGESNATCPADCPAGDPNSCVGHCQGQAPGGCYCDTACTQSGDCCSDYKAVCGGTCTPNCTGKACGLADGCGGKCSGPCPVNGQVCSAAKTCVTPTIVCGNGVCESGETAANCAKDCGAATKTCKGYCGKAGLGGCYCDTACVQNNDCCPDYATQCGGGSSSVCPNGKCEAGETAASCPADCKTGCFGDFTLGKTFYTSGDTKQLGLACNPAGAPKNCPDGDWIDFGDSGDCICIVSCGALGLSLGQSCTTDGAWQCQNIKATNASANGGKYCVPTKWALCQL